MNQRESEAFDAVDAVLKVAAIVRRERARVTGAPGTDSTPFAGHLAAALLAAGGRLPDKNPHTLRHPFDDPGCRAAADPSGIVSALELIATIATCLQRGPGADHELELAAQHWPAAKTKAEAEEAVAKVERVRVDAEAAKVRAAHEARLAAQQAQERAARQLPRPKPVRAEEDPLRDDEMRLEPELLGAQ